MRDSSFLAEQNAKAIWHPMAHPGNMRSHPPRVIMKGEGVTITDLEGRTVLDAVGGLWNVNLGYSSEPVKKAIADQLALLPYYSGFKGTSTGPAIELSHALCRFFEPEGMARVFFTSGGSDSVETALRLARQYWKVRGQHDRTKFISLKRGYHGTHFGGASVNGNATFRRNYEPLLPGCYHIPTPHVYRNPFGETDARRLAGLCAAALEDEIVFQGPDTVAAFIMEPVLGAAGVVSPHESFMPLVREICDRHEVLLIADEVITGFGRTGAWSGSRLWNVRPDLMCLAKAITSGYFPLGAALVGGKVAAAMESNQDSFGSIGHGYTYSGHPVGCAAGIAALEETQRLKVHENAAARGCELRAALEELKARHAVVGDVRVQGLMGALEIVSDRGAKTPMAAEGMSRIQAGAYEAGVMVRISGCNVILSPPLVIDAGDVRKIAEAVDAGLRVAGRE